MLSNPTLEHISDINKHTSVVSLSSGLLTPEEWQSQQDAQAPTPSDLKSPPPTSKEEDATDAKVMSPVPKPEVNLEDMDAKVMSPVPNTGDRDAKVMSPVPKPEVNPGEALSKEAIDKRLRRIFQPRSDGSYLVSDEFVKKYLSRGEDREKLLVMFEKCNYKPDRCCGCSCCARGHGVEP